jgi:hypothetical protein
MGIIACSRCEWLGHIVCSRCNWMGHIVSSMKNNGYWLLVVLIHSDLILFNGFALVRGHTLLVVSANDWVVFTVVTASDWVVLRVISLSDWSLLYVLPVIDWVTLQSNVYPLHHCRQIHIDKIRLEPYQCEQAYYIVKQ